MNALHKILKIYTGFWFHTNFLGTIILNSHLWNPYFENIQHRK